MRLRTVESWVHEFDDYFDELDERIATLKYWLYEELAHAEDEEFKRDAYSRVRDCYNNLMEVASKSPPMTEDILNILLENEQLIAKYNSSTQEDQC